MKLLVTGGGTGGHVYPALAVVEALLAEPAWGTSTGDIAWVGTAESIEERIIARTPLRFHRVSTGALHGAGPLRALKSLVQMFRGYHEARLFLAEFRPGAVLATGGYVSVPLVLAASRLGIPTLIYLPDMAPGQAVRFLQRYATRIAVSFQTVARYFPADKVLVSGYPVRAALTGTDKSAARRALGLSETLSVLLVFGGSRGAHAINIATDLALHELLQLGEVVHITGSEDYEEFVGRQEALAPARAARYHPYAYLYDQMPAALAAADLVIARAGAATLGEFPAVGLPAILVPYPFSGQHQDANASYLASCGAGIILTDAGLETKLAATVRALLTDHTRLEAMSAAARALAVPDAARRIAAELVSLARGEK